MINYQDKWLCWWNRADLKARHSDRREADNADVQKQRCAVGQQSTESGQARSHKNLISELSEVAISSKVKSAASTEVWQRC